MLPEDIKKLEESILKRRAEVLAQLEEVSKENPAVKGDREVIVKDYGNDEYDNAQEETDLERDFALEQQLESELRELDRALEKIKNGTYGACDRCSGSIDEKRVKAIPRATLCISCAQKTVR